MSNLPSGKEGKIDNWPYLRVYNNPKRFKVFFETFS